MSEEPEPTIPADRSLAVFCDFDGTFSVQDVGSTLARERLAARRRMLWARFEQGEFTAWSYVVELFDGFELPQAELFRFLETITLDPGARGLVDWCAKVRVPFQILSDGFDWNLDRLQEIHDVRFAYRANHLEYEGDVWRIAPGAPNPDCNCGTGTCKRGLIAAYRKANPKTWCVHIGNGRVSDQCGAGRGYDTLVFATGTRARDLPLPGIKLPGVYSLRKIDDVRRLRPALDNARRIAIVGGGYIGLEVAAVMRQEGRDAVVVETEGRVMKRVAGEAISGFFDDAAPLARRRHPARRAAGRDRR